MAKRRLMTPQSEMDQLRSLLTRLADAVMAQIRDLRAAMLGRTLGSLQHIVKNDKEIDSLELALGQVAKNFMEFHAPLGPDFRFVLAALDIARNLERIGDCVEYVARHVQVIFGESQEFGEGEHLALDMIDGCLRILDRAVSSLSTQDLESAREIPPLDDQVDALKRETFERVIQVVRAGTIDVKLGLEYVLIAGKLESIADIACHIAESVVFIVSAKDIRHGPRP